MKRVILPLLAVLAACAPPPPVFKPVTVEVPVATPCRAPDIAAPASPLATTKADASLFDKVKAALIEIDLRRAYETQLQAALDACRS